MSELTTTDIEAMLARAEAATPGPWEAQRHDDSTCSAVYVIAAPAVPNPRAVEECRGDLHKITSICCAGCNAPECPQPTDSDAAFIAAARTDLPLLAHEVLRLRKLVATRPTKDVLAGIAARLHDDADYAKGFAEESGKLDAKLLIKERDQLRESLNWALGQLVDLDAVRVHRPTRQLFCDYCSPHQGILAHRPDCPYARAMKLLEEKP